MKEIFGETNLTIKGIRRKFKIQKGVGLSIFIDDNVSVLIDDNVTIKHNVKEDKNEK